LAKLIDGDMLIAEDPEDIRKRNTLIQQPVESASPRHGLVVGGRYDLEYLEFNSKKWHMLSSGRWVHSITTDSEDIFFGESDMVCNLFRNYRFNCQCMAKDLLVVEGKVIGCGYGIINYSDHRALLSSEIRKYFFESVMTNDENFYGLCKNLASSDDQEPIHSLYKLKDFWPSDELITYTESHSNPCQARIIPYGSCGEYPFSFISSANSHFLDINGEMIEGSEKYDPIHCVQWLDIDGHIADVLYSSDKIHQAKVDLREKKIIEEIPLQIDENLVPHTLAIVRSEEMHQRLTEYVEIKIARD